ncbi:hypothetical protein M378DRAFT_78807 [Amanita muscaria Koide BX008]|uniref:Hypervirulence associated protein TUDOR domain-containing protein n=1 Tax=Amanita muscaria (strain Koide BX008) TaxID=946122 RepID=A0A0C2SLN5_AMAMK|nr:hypothetical protein M378DRAFT_78807 [Amanita muscaria Koide BX008]
MPSNSKVHDKFGKLIRVGDVVSCRARGGKQFGEVTDIVDRQEAEEKGVAHPPKVIYVRHTVSHNPKTLVHGEDPNIGEKED